MGKAAVRHPWMVLFSLLTVAFLAFSLPPYLGFDPAQARVPIRPDVPGYYPLLVTHILCGSVAMLTACVQLWPGMRRRQPAVHRWGGRLYFLAGALPASVAVAIISPFGEWGLNQQVSNTVLAVLWFGTSVAGFRAARQGRYAQHRDWMIRSVALAFAIVSTRIWFVLWALLLVQSMPADRMVGDEVLTAQVFGVSHWLGWVVNLAVAEWWLQRRRRVSATAPEAARVRA